MDNEQDSSSRATQKRIPNLGSRQTRAIPTTRSRGAKTARQAFDQDASTTTATHRKGSVSVAPDMNAELWLREQLGAYGFADIQVKQSRVKWTVKADGSSLGQIEARSVADRDIHAVQRMLRLPVVVRVEIVRPTTEAYDGDDAQERLNQAWKRLRDELFESGRLMGRYMTALCQDLRWEDHGRAEDYSQSDTNRQSWVRKRLEYYEEERLEKTGVSFSKGSKDVMTQAVTSAFAKWKKANYADRLAEFTSGTILLRNISWRLERTTAPVRWVVHFALLSEKVKTKTGGSKQQLRWYSVVVSTSNNGHVHATLKKMLSGEITPCDAKLVWERGNRRWAFRLVGMRPPAKRAQGPNTMAIRRSVKHPLQMTLSDGMMHDIPGGAYLAAKTGLAARKQAVQKVRWVRGKGCNVHGRKKRNRVSDHIAEKEKNLTKKTIEQWWSNAIKIAKRRGVSTIVVEDFSVPLSKDFLEAMPKDMAWTLKRFPWGALKSWGEWVCKRTGFRLVEVSAASRAHTCPVCDDESPENYLADRHHTLCVACGVHMPTDWAEGWNMLKRSGLLTDDSALRSKQRAWAKQMKEVAEIKYLATG